jgi:release factor glutamine methyltransferase
MRTTFYDLPFETERGRVFTPRPATEALVDAALQRIDGVPMRIADVGTGSGAIAVALAVNRPEVEVWATDTSPEAVEVARANAARNGVADRVHVIEGDLLTPIELPVDLVVANLRICRSGSTILATTTSRRRPSMRRATGSTSIAVC